MNKKSSIAKRVLIIGNGGIACNEKHIPFTGKDIGKFISELKENGFKVVFCDYKGDAQTNKFIYTFNLKEKLIRHKIIHLAKPYSYINIFRLTLSILFHTNIYIWYPGGLSEISARICRFFKRKYGVYVRGYGLYIPDEIKKSKVDFQFNNLFILENASFLITNSPKMQSDLMIYNQRVDTITDIIWDVDEIYYRVHEREDVSFWRFIFVGSIVELKGIFELIQTVRILNNSGLKFVIRLIGDGLLLPELIEKQNSGEIPVNIVFVGPVTNKKQLEEEYQKADALIFPSRTEGFPRTLYEAMLKELPIFTTIVGGISGIMVPGYNCIELPVRNPKSQAETILNGINNKELMVKISENGLKTVIDILKEKKSHPEVLINNFRGLK